MSGLLMSSVSFSQDAIEDYIPTENLDPKKDSNTKSNRSDNRIREIFVKSTFKIGYGNPCVEEATSKMGFIYAPVVPPFTSEFKRNWHNWWVKLGLVVRRGPWWKITANKRIKECRNKTGDIVGA
ncbi:MAG: hypothetical protein RJQ09_19835 [Cyclobacteriaceae bacterium]